MEDGSDLLLYVVKVKWNINNSKKRIDCFKIVGFFGLVSLLGHDSFVAESIQLILLDQDKGTCSNIEKLVKNIYTNQDVIEYKFRLKNRPGQTYPTVIGRIHIDILGKILHSTLNPVSLC